MKLKDWLWILFFLKIKKNREKRKIEEWIFSLKQQFKRKL